MRIVEEIRDMDGCTPFSEGTAELGAACVILGFQCAQRNMFLGFQCAQRLLTHRASLC